MCVTDLLKLTLKQQTPKAARKRRAERKRRQQKALNRIADNFSRLALTGSTPDGRTGCDVSIGAPSSRAMSTEVKPMTGKSARQRFRRQRKAISKLAERMEDFALTGSDPLSEIKTAGDKEENDVAEEHNSPSTKHALKQRRRRQRRSMEKLVEQFAAMSLSSDSADFSCAELSNSV